LSLNKNNVLVVYRQGDSDSHSFALRYQSMRGLSSDQIVSIPCSNVEILDNYEEFKNQVEDPIKNALTSVPVSNYNIYAIVLCPFVPGGFVDENDVISSTSRISRINHNFNKRLKNNLFDRRLFSSFSSEDSNFSIICSRFDAPTYEILDSWIKNTEKAIKRIIVNGDFYLDPYSGFYGGDFNDYTNELINFQQYFMPLTGNEVVISNYIDPYTDSIIPYVENDSFFWGWGADRGSMSFFKNSSSIRCFFYNADSDGSYTMRDLDERNWPVMSVRNGYISTAGSTSDPGADGYLRPRPFIETLFKGSSLGEAFLFSQPYLDWTVSCFGDPLLSFRFPKEEDGSGLVEENKAWLLMMEEMSKSIIRINRKSNIIEDIRNTIINGEDTEVATDILYPVEEMYQSFKDEMRKNDFTHLSKSVINLATNRNKFKYDSYYPNLNEYLSYSGNYINEIFVNSTNDQSLVDSLDASNLSIEGSWYYDFILEHIAENFTYYHFEIDISDDSNFSNIIYNRSSLSDQDGWFFEKYNNVFDDVTKKGVGSNYSSKKIRYYNTKDLLERSNRYYIRYRQRYLTHFGSYNYDSFIVYA